MRRSLALWHTRSGQPPQSRGVTASGQGAVDGPLMPQTHWNRSHKSRPHECSVTGGQTDVEPAPRDDPAEATKPRRFPGLRGPSRPLCAAFSVGTPACPATETAKIMSRHTWCIRGCRSVVTHRGDTARRQPFRTLGGGADGADARAPPAPRRLGSAALQRHPSPAPCQDRGAPALRRDPGGADDRGLPRLPLPRPCRVGHQFAWRCVAFRDRRAGREQGDRRAGRAGHPAAAAGTACVPVVGCSRLGGVERHVSVRRSPAHLRTSRP
jgi:hypothetical protein